MEEASGGFSSTETRFHLRIQWPRTGHNQPRIEERVNQRLPPLSRFVGVDNDGNAVRFQYAVDFLERQLERLLKEPFPLFKPPVPCE